MYEWVSEMVIRDVERERTGCEKRKEKWEVLAVEERENDGKA
jgi:hypothetical protein